MSDATNNKVDNAIILAAGCARRCLPYSASTPKGLFEVRGEILLERQIKQIRDAGIDQIVLVVGYLADKFTYLKEKFGIEIVYNPEYSTANNMSSIYYAKDYLANSYICGSDNWYSETPFSNNNNQSYYSCLYSDTYVDEYCISIENDQIIGIRKGGQKCWYTLGEIYLDKKTTDFIRNDLEKNYKTSDIKNLIIDDYCIRNIDKLRFKAKYRPEGLIYEFDTVEEFCAFDEHFTQYLRKLEDK